MMRLFGFLFLIVLVLAVVGFFRGWYTVTAVEARGKTEVTLDIDKTKISNDTVAAADKLSELSAKAAEQVRKLAKEIGAQQTAFEGSVTAVDVEARSVQLTAEGETVDLSVPTGAAITQDGGTIALTQLTAGLRVRVTLDQQGDALTVARIEVLP